MASTTSSIKQKINNSFISEESKALASDIGVEQRFVKKLLGSQNNNYEEQFIQGIDNCKYSYFEDGNKYTGIRFINENVGSASNGYYFLYIEEIPYEENKYYFDDNIYNLNIENNQEELIKIETLYFRKNLSSKSYIPLSTDKRISKKEVYYFYNQVNEKTTIREVITNYL